MTKPIPISAAERIAKDYGYDQVIILGRKIGQDGGEHMTTYGVNPANCSAAGLIGKTMQRWMGWFDHLGTGPDEAPKTRKPGSTEGMSPERAAEFTRRPDDGSFSEQEGEYYR